MAESLTIARPYAEAAFGIALERNALPSWSDALARLAVVAGTEVARELIGNPQLSNAQVAALVADAAGQIAPEQKNFVQVLAANGRLAVLPEISALFDRLRNEQEGVLDARIASAYPLDERQVDEVVAALREKYGKQIKATVHVDAELIGGVSIRIGDEVIDASVRGKLAQMAGALKL
ncbi:MAG: F0F1 ATP synthase subunit delta [Lautropia sp.]|nr:F0F1 ATP synthase subunit delta [Lautropia sp.]MCL4701230.1 F0F1 ATP synthase subunit delta [Burkholderiaceae bacterium]MDL1906216.1 F0F1 ATP synthase subunit delta [Betaproteobacteria bacterium PRO1]RIK85216.1 MAG: F0F1 ATP synthase subunit delta [Burkholderiales bacterium]